ncbi:hypothetical protein T4D_10655 [Trichinella pseudospiralis]|uniref:Uncharacterized protein n=1 Tax=Trichinella pseudospiralis TaxID=6337 RepID=A0A0V1F5D4_TRIPS|nr:hypothetical protein T4D_10655 [Trichinella pseudospiralis]
MQHIDTKHQSYCMNSQTVPLMTLDQIIVSKFNGKVVMFCKLIIAKSFSLKIIEYSASVCANRFVTCYSTVILLSEVERNRYYCMDDRHSRENRVLTFHLARIEYARLRMTVIHLHKYSQHWRRYA